MADVTNLRGDGGVAFLVSAGLVAEMIAAACSSPQTTEINAKQRAPTLMKWVHVGESMAVVLAIIAIIISKHKLAIAGGTAIALAMFHISYRHAMKCGLASGEPGTEDTATGSSSFHKYFE